MSVRCIRSLVKNGEGRRGRVSFGKVCGVYQEGSAGRTWRCLSEEIGKRHVADGVLATGGCKMGNGEGVGWMGM